MDIKHFFSEQLKKVLPGSEQKEGKAELEQRLRKTESDLKHRLKQLGMQQKSGKFPTKEDADFLLGNTDFYENTNNYHLFNSIICQFAEFYFVVQPHQALQLVELPKFSGFEKMKERFPEETFEAISGYIKASCDCLFSEDENIRSDHVFSFFPVISSHKKYLSGSDIDEYVFKKIYAQCAALEQIIGAEGQSERTVHYARKIDMELQCVDMLLPGFTDLAKYVANTYKNVNALINSGKL